MTIYHTSTFRITRIQHIYLNKQDITLPLVFVQGPYKSIQAETITIYFKKCNINAFWVAFFMSNSNQQ